MEGVSCKWRYDGIWKSFKRCASVAIKSASIYELYKVFPSQSPWDGEFLK